MKLLIVASGLATRVYSYTYQKIPKYLISLDHYFGLYHMIQYWKKYVDEIYIIIHPYYKKITEYYIQHFLSDVSIQLLYYEQADGTACTIQNTLLQTFTHDDLETETDKRMIITWCDIFPSNEVDIPFDDFYENRVFTYGTNCRYGYNEEIHKIINYGNTGGDVIGIYYIHDYTKINTLQIEYGTDFVDYIEYLGDFDSFYLSKVIDYGDEYKIMEYKHEYYQQQQKQIEHRHFNKIEIIDNEILCKYSITNQGYQIIKKEIQWYEHLFHHDINIKEMGRSILKPLQIEDNKIYLPYIQHHKKIYEIIENDELDICEKRRILSMILHKMNHLHHIHSIPMIKEKWIEDIQYEIEDKIRERCQDIIPILEDYSSMIEVNGIEILSLDEILQKVKEIIYEYYENENRNQYDIIHGDLNFSNILYDEDMDDIIFIDPRGYFGKTMIYGYKEYDESKILYGLSGYDKFNRDIYFKPDYVDSTKIHFSITSYEYLLPELRTKLHYAFLTIIWLGLAQYNKNNYWKCVCSYYHGLYIGTKYLFLS